MISRAISFSIGNLNLELIAIIKALARNLRNLCYDSILEYEILSNDQEDEMILSPARSSLSSSSSLTINSSLSYDNEAYLVYIPHIQWNESKASLSSHERLHYLLWAMDTPSSRLPSIPLKYTHWPIIIVDILFSKLLLGLTFFVNDASPRKVPNSLVFTA